MKKVLIVSSSLSTGGLEKCLIDLCNVIDYNKYCVDLYLFNEGRQLLPELNKNVRLLPDSPYYKVVYNYPFFKSILALLKKGQIRLLFYRIKRFIRARLRQNEFTLSDWKMMKKTMLDITEHYDAAIGYEECTACYYVADCVDASVKSGWIHTDLKQIQSNRVLDRSAFEKLDHICTVSQNSMNSLIELYPQFEKKYKLFFTPAFFNYKKIDEMSLEESGFDKSYINIVSVGRLVELKGFQLCVKPLRRLIDDGYLVRWYVVGEGPNRENLEQMIKEFDVESSFVLLGNQNNPYKYINSADICVQPSSYEGLSLVGVEEKYLKKALVATKIASYLQILENEKNGLLIERNEEEIYLAVKRLIENKDLRMAIASEPIKGYVEKDVCMDMLEVLLNENQQGI